MTELLKLFVPKGGMCINCKNVNNNCANLDFSSMPTIDTNYLDQSKTLVHRVRCSEFIRKK
jgi:hypothetical protein